MKHKAILAGGCFWGVQELMGKLYGVTSSQVGYIGGDTSAPTYEQVKTSTTGHAEAVEVEFDPSVISYREVLAYFFKIHDPTTQDRQSGDIGSQYRSAIFYLNDKQKEVAEEVLSTADASGIWPDKIVTEVLPAPEFFPAENYHQDYLQKNPDGYNCHIPRPHWNLPPEPATDE